VFVGLFFVGLVFIVFGCLAVVYWIVMMCWVGWAVCGGIVDGFLFVGLVG